MKQGVKIPYTLDYYQGPRDSIALMMFWRKKTKFTPAEGNCGKQYNNQFFGNPGEIPAPTQEYLDFLSRGWSVIPSTSYKLPDDVTNSCATTLVMVTTAGATVTSPGETCAGVDAAKNCKTIGIGFIPYLAAPASALIGIFLGPDAPNLSPIPALDSIAWNFARN
ncbi:MAG: hypothetical protein H7301_01160 [Cryobacterium sp.]|nr:hypothetical protein [Oligoflexia bacterium]